MTIKSPTTADKAPTNLSAVITGTTKGENANRRQRDRGIPLPVASTGG